MDLSRRFARSVTRHRYPWSVAALLVLAGAITLSLRLSLREDVRDFQPKSRGAPDPTEAAVRNLLGGADRIIVLLEAEQPVQAVPMAALLDTLAARLGAIPGIQRVDYRVPPSVQDFLTTRASRYLLFAFDTTQLAALAARLAPDSIRRLLRTPRDDAAGMSALAGRRVLDPLRLLVPAAAVLERALGGARLGLLNGYFAIPGQRGFVLIVEPTPGTSVDSMRALVRHVELVLQQLPQEPRFSARLAGMELRASGRPVAAVHFFDLAFGDVVRVALASLLLSFLIQLVLFRRLLAPLLLAGTALYALALTGAAAALLFGTVSLMAWLFISVLIGLGDEFALYIVAHYWLTGAAQQTREAALASALQRPGRGLLYSGLAMAAAFASLSLLSYPVMFQLACITTLGLFAMLGASFTVLPIALAYCRPTRVAPASTWARGLSSVQRLGSGLRHRWRWLAGWSVLLLACAWGTRTIRFEPYPWKLALRGNPASAEIERVRQLLGVWPSPILMVSGGASEAEALQHDREAVYQLDRVGSRAGVVTIESLTRWLPPPEQQRAALAFLQTRRDVFDPQRVRRAFLAALAALPQADPRLASDYLPRVLGLLATSRQQLTVDELRRLGLDSLVEHHLVHAGGQVLAVSYVYLAQSPWTAGVIDQFEETLSMGEGEALSRAHFVGDALRGATRAGRLRHDIILATAVALFLVAGLLILQFRRVAPVLLCLLPLVCGVSAALGLMAALGLPLNVLTLSIAPLLVGLCVDDGIHLLERLERGEDRVQVLQDSGAAIIVTTLTTVTGFASLLFARFPGVRELGLTGSVGILVALAASLQLVPMLHAMRKR